MNKVKRCKIWCKKNKLLSIVNINDTFITMIINNFHCLLYITVFILSKNAFSSSYDAGKDKSLFFGHSSPDEIIVNLAYFLNSKDVAQLTKTNKRNEKILSQSSLNGGKELRLKSKFGVVDDHGQAYFLEEFLSLPGKNKISKINNISLLIQENPEYFIKLVLKTIPDTPESIQS